MKASAAGGSTDDEALLAFVTSANVACGFHAGDPATMRRVCALAAERGVRDRRAGVLPRSGGLRPPVHGRAAAELAAEVAYQIGALEIFARAAGGRVAYVKPHGALYNRIVRDDEQAAAVVEGAARPGRRALPVLGLPGSRLHAAADEAGLPVVEEAFADRAYRPDGTLCPRRSPAPWCTDPEHGGAALACGWPATARSTPSTARPRGRAPGRCACTATPPAPSAWPAATRSGLGVRIEAFA